jgi:hypothetical protein
LQKHVEDRCNAQRPLSPLWERGAARTFDNAHGR